MKNYIPNYLLLTIIILTANIIIAQKSPSCNNATGFYKLNSLIGSNISSQPEGRFLDSEYWDKVKGKNLFEENLSSIGIVSTPNFYDRTRNISLQNKSFEFLIQTSREKIKNEKEIESVLQLNMAEAPAQSASFFDNELIYFIGGAVIATAAYFLIAKGSEPEKTTRTFGYPPNPEN